MQQSETDWNFVANNDDAYPSYGSGNVQDSGITFNNIAAGTYLATVTDYSTVANGNLLSLGFTGDELNNSAGDYTLTIEGINISPVPEAEEWAMMMLGLGMIGFITKRK